MRKILILLTCIYSYNIAFTQLPNTNIYLFQMEQQSDSLFNFVNPKFLTEFNSDGYNNQPSFIANDEIYFSMGSTSEESQTDIISINLKTRIKTQITLSEDSEYSPTSLLEPYYFSCVRQEADGKNTQRAHAARRFAALGSGPIKCTIAASKWRRYRSKMSAAGSYSACKGILL